MPVNKMLLYVGKQHNKSVFCPGSQMCLDYIEKNHLSNITLQDVQKLMSEDVSIPSWLDGTPILVNKSTGELFKGTDAVNALKSIQGEPNSKAGNDTEIEGVTTV